MPYPIFLDQPRMLPNENWLALTPISASCNIMRSLGERHSPLVTYCLWAAREDPVP